MKTRLITMIGLLSAGCSLSPPPGPAPQMPAPAPTPTPPGPRLPLGEPNFQDQQLDFTIIAGPETMAAGKTENLTARLMAPPGSQVVGVQATQGKDAYTYALKLAMHVPTDAGAPKALEVQIPFSPPAGGTYYLDSMRRYAVQVTSSSIYGSSYGGGYPNGSGYTPSFLDRSTYTGGAYVPGGSATSSTSTLSPASTDNPAPSLFGTVVTLSTLTTGAIQGNDHVTARDLMTLQGPTYGRHGDRLRYTASLWTAGTGPIRPDVVQNGYEVKVSALIAPADREAVDGVPMPRQTSIQFSWTFQDPGLYRITSQNGITLGTVQVY